MRGGRGHLQVGWGPGVERSPHHEGQRARPRHVAAFMTKQQFPEHRPRAGPASWRSSRAGACGRLCPQGGPSVPLPGPEIAFWSKTWQSNSFGLRGLPKAGRELAWAPRPDFQDESLMTVGRAALPRPHSHGACARHEVLGAPLASPGAGWPEPRDAGHRAAVRGQHQVPGCVRGATHDTSLHSPVERGWSSSPRWESGSRERQGAPDLGPALRLTSAPPNH